MNQFLSKFAGSKNGLPSAGIGLLGALGALAYGGTKSVYTGISIDFNV